MLAFLGVILIVLVLYKLTRFSIKAYYRHTAPKRQLEKQKMVGKLIGFSDEELEKMFGK